MGNTTPINFAVNSYQARSGILSSEKLINFYPELAPERSPFQVALHGTPGLKQWKDLSQFEGIEGMIVMGENIFVVCGNTVYKINENKSATNLGKISTVPDRVQMTENRSQVTILTESGRAFYATTSDVNEITDSDYQNSTSVTTLNGYSIFTKQDTDQFFISSLLDTTAYDPLKFATAEGRSDILVNCTAHQNELWLFGERSIEIWYNSANPDFPFDRINGAFIEKGCAAKDSVASDETGIYWLGDDNVIYKAQGYLPAKISTHAIEKAIESYAVTSDAFSFVYTQEGHKFYCLTFPTAKKTWVYSINNGLWHERESVNPNTSQIESWRPNCHVFFAGKNLIGDPRTGIIYELDLDTYDEDGYLIQREATSATQFANFSRMNLNRFTLLMDTGVGIDGNAQGFEPQMMLQTSTDGGKTFGNEMWQPVGKIGSYDTEVYWTGLGHGRSLIVKIAISDPVKLSIVGAYLNSEIGYS